MGLTTLSWKYPIQPNRAAFFNDMEKIIANFSFKLFSQRSSQNNRTFHNVCKLSLCGDEHNRLAFFLLVVTPVRFYSSYQSLLDQLVLFYAVSMFCPRWSF